MRGWLIGLGAVVVVVGCSGSDESGGEPVDDAGGLDAAAGSGGSGGTASDSAVPDAGAPDADAATAPDADAAPEPKLEIESFQEEVWTWDQTSDSCSYSNNGNPFWDWMIVGREPVDTGSYPVFAYFHGLGDVADSPVQTSIVDSMASRGFVAGSVPYDSFGGIGQIMSDPNQVCAIFQKKAQCLFGAGEGSALTKLCARPKADCSKGIVLGGHSEGSGLVIFAKNYDARVRAVWALGAGIHGDVTIEIGGTTYEATSDLSPCILPPARALPYDRLRVVNGESEYIYGANLQQDVRDLTDHDCPAGSMECLRPNGSGWSFFPDSANEDGRGTSEHCYMANMPAGDCTASTGLNSTWTGGTQSYAREPNLTWLRGFTDP